MGVTAPPAAGVRLAWAALPAGTREEVERHLGDRVAEAVSQPGGFSPGVAARLRLAGGGRAFVKAVSAAQNPDSPAMHRSEARIAAALPPGVPAPRLLTSFDRDGWVVLLFEDVEGRTPAMPWDPAELRRVLDALTELTGALTPAPVPVTAAADRFREEFQGWRRLAADPDEGLGPWALRHLDRLAELEAGWPVALKGDTLAHADLRADNILLAQDGRVLFVDWPWACPAPPWFDLLGMLPSVAMQGGPPPAEVFGPHPVARGADPDAVTAVLAGLTGFFLEFGRRPPPPGLPTLRAFQRAQGAAALAWLRERTGWR
ncbi:hypothetical protein GCM10009530_26540 [Microbispora corallina]|uniref:Aminoglycoside phosphotransferase domain-containing protein n=1 Tax=Microbispora corallina TaxID=83302 RepID=A0ABQ4G4X9_9ACTN|nr:hypothetical protein Mco01_51350 [Microbispora corallina]